MEKTLELTFQRRDVDEDLVSLARSGDRAAFDQLFEKHKRYIYNICYRMLGSQDDARDAAQTTFIRAFRSLPKFRGESSFKSWLYRIAINVSAEMSKKRKHQDIAPLTETIAAPSDRSRETVEEAIAGLPPDHRAVLVLFYIQGLSGEEVAEVLGCSHEAVRARLHRARVALKKKYEELEDEL